MTDKLSSLSETTGYLIFNVCETSRHSDFFKILFQDRIGSRILVSENVLFRSNGATDWSEIRSDRLKFQLSNWHRGQSVHIMWLLAVHCTLHSSGEIERYNCAVWCGSLWLDSGKMAEYRDESYESEPTNWFELTVENPFNNKRLFDKFSRRSSQNFRCVNLLIICKIIQ